MQKAAVMQEAAEEAAAMQEASGVLYLLLRQASNARHTLNAANHNYITGQT